MPKIVFKRLSARRVETEKRTGMHCDGMGLYLRVSGAARSWVFRYTGFDGKQHDMGLGSTRVVTLQMARDNAIDLHRQMRSGVDPLGHQRTTKVSVRAKAVKTFKDCVREYMLKKTTLNPIVRKDRENRFDKFAKELYDVPIEEVTADIIVSMLAPHWMEDQTSKAKLLQTIGAVLEHATGSKAAAVQARRRLPDHTHKEQHFASLPWRDAPAFMRDLRAVGSIAAYAAEFAILTAVRNQEAGAARWDEIDWLDGVWTIPNDRMKKRLAHTVPLSGPALAVLEHMRSIAQGDYIFPGSTRLRQFQGRVSLLHVIQRVRPDLKLTVHGWRSTFTGWAKSAKYPPDLRKEVLAHVSGDKTDQAYDRERLLIERRPMMEAWARYLSGATVVPFQGATEAA